MRAIMQPDADGTAFRIAVVGATMDQGDELRLMYAEIPDGMSTIAWPEVVIIRRRDGTEERCRIQTAAQAEGR
jgi:hypothetical protein